MIQRAPKMRPDQLIIANLSGRGDKDVAQAAEFFLEGKKPWVLEQIENSPKTERLPAATLRGWNLKNALSSGARHRKHPRAGET